MSPAGSQPSPVGCCAGKLLVLCEYGGPAEDALGGL